jgi:hypothetical protein
MAVTVPICAIIVREFTALRIAMSTCPIILPTAHPSVPIIMVALHRGSEVILAALVGGAFHWAAEVVVDTLTGTQPALAGHGAVLHVSGQSTERRSIRYTGGDPP